MAEWSKAPDSRIIPCLRRRVFWSTYVGVGSNPTSDKPIFFLFKLYFLFAMCTYHVTAGQKWIAAHSPFVCINGFRTMYRM